MSAPTASPQTFTDGRSLSSVLSVIWHEAHPYRAAIHRAACVGRCDVRIGRAGFRLDGDCACRDFLLDMVAECHRYLAQRGGTLANPLGAARQHMRNRAPDWNRRRRAAMGAQARTDRIRSCRRADELPDDFHRALLEYLVDEAGSMAPLDGPEDLVRRLAVRCAAEFGGGPEDYPTRVVDGMAVVERHCRAQRRVNAGTPEHPEFVSWWDMYIELPMGRRPRRTVAEMPADLAVPDVDRSDEDVQILAVLERAARHRPEAREAALRASIRELARLGLLPERRAAELLADHAWLTRTVQLLSALA